ncbi:DnaD domain protein [Salinibacillus aidingensis]|uniref:DnaD domain protein n=1 Tax=Salinibacillus aidingensis TaxID=237684 RepID=A0ABP3L478_9BACI
MARYRQVHIDFWQDGFVLDLTPEEKYFYLYLMTNSKTTQCGIYELPKRIIETETGYNRETVEKLLNRFTEYGKIIYHEPTREIMMVNWIKYNWINSKKVFSLISKELHKVKNHEFIKVFIEKCKEYGYRIDTLSIPHANDIEEKNEESLNDKGSIPYQYPTDSPSIDLGEEVEEEEEREVEREREKEREVEEENATSTPSDAIQFYQNNFGVISPYVSEDMISWIEDLGDEMVIEALRRSLERNKASWGYAKSILQSWFKKGIKSLEQAKAEEVEYKNQQAAKHEKVVEIPNYKEGGPDERSNGQHSEESGNVRLYK